MKENKILFKSIEGGKSEEPFLTKQKKEAVITEKITEQASLTPKETSELVADMANQRRLGIRESVLRFNKNRILSDDEADFIYNRFVGMSLGNKEIIEELNERFPDLVGFFDKTMNDLKNLREELNQE
ncbi:MAG TPA: hypothetical protein DCS08_03530 [Candidatus Moranbacteria bacterium]|nr:MAG: hypothetical protein US27_C0022G0008 [Candidatus Moranbacteria bacterium GW2011_GWF1_36_78]HAT74051.1 hypothetical protein [Candidatus Moranbacteria bacterium]HBY11311.1 hypothetical protein [Candidatus Moranbacteria bacterium]